MSRRPTPGTKLEAPANALTVVPGGVRLRVRLTPKSSRDALDAQERLADGSVVLAARVRAVPEDGKANAALEALIATAADVARSRVSVVAGATSRLKIIEIKGDAAEIARRLPAAPGAV